MLVIAPPLGPSCTVQVTAVLVLPVTVAMKVCAPPGGRVTEVGEIVTETAGNTVTAAESNFVVSTTDSATTVSIVATVTLGAV